MIFAIVGEFETPWIHEDLGRDFKAEAVLAAIEFGLGKVPLELHPESIGLRNTRSQGTSTKREWGQGKFGAYVPRVGRKALGKQQLRLQARYVATGRYIAFPESVRTARSSASRM